MFPRGDSLSAWDLEQYLIPYEEWGQHLANIPEAQRKSLEEDIPIGLGKHPKLGYFINCCGQGPCTVWAEFEIPEAE